MKKQLSILAVVCTLAAYPLTACKHSAPKSAEAAKPTPKLADFFGNLPLIEGHEVNYSEITLTKSEKKILFFGETTINYDLLLAEDCHYRLPAGSVSYNCPNLKCREAVDFAAISFNLPEAEVDCTLKTASVQVFKSGVKNFIKQGLQGIKDLFSTLKENESPIKLYQELYQEAHSNYLAAQQETNCQQAKKWLTNDIYKQYLNYLSEFQINITTENIQTTFSSETCNFAQQNEIISLEEAENILNRTLIDDDSSSDIDFVAANTGNNEVRDNPLFQDITYLLNSQEDFKQKIVRNQLRDFKESGKIDNDSCYIFIYNTMKNRQYQPIQQNVNPNCSQEKLLEETAILMEQICTYPASKSWFKNFLQKAEQQNQLTKDSAIITTFEEKCQLEL